MVATIASTDTRARPLNWLVGLVVVAVGCTSSKDYFDGPLNLGGQAGSTIGSGAGTGGATGSTGGVIGSGNQSGGGRSGRDGGESGGSGSGRGSSGGHEQGGSAGTAPVAGDGGTVAGGRAGGGDAGADTAGDAGEVGVAGDRGAGGAGGDTCVPEAERCDGVSNDCDVEVDEDEVCPAGCELKFSEDRLYVLCLHDDPDDQLVFEAASHACEDLGVTLGLGSALALVRLESAPENTFMKAWIAASASGEGMVWHGANDLDQENRWVWGREPDEVRFFTATNLGGGTPFMGRFENFAPGRPNATNGSDEDCGAFDSEFSWQWNDIVCSVPRLGFACEQVP